MERVGVQHCVNMTNEMRYSNITEVCLPNVLCVCVCLHLSYTKILHTWILCINLLVLSSINHNYFDFLFFLSFFCIKLFCES